jgi:hypothetical protein
MIMQRFRGTRGILTGPVMVQAQNPLTLTSTFLYWLMGVMWVRGGGFLYLDDSRKKSSKSKMTGWSKKLAS